MRLETLVPLTALLLLAPAAPVAGAAESSLSTLAAWLTGHFSSAAQAAADPEFRAVELRAVPIWTERDDGPWIYVEQALVTSVERPYRQRVLRLAAREDGRLASAVHLLPGDPLRFAGAWREQRPLAALAPADLLPRTGCDVLLRRDEEGVFRGGTEGTGCASELRGAAYATSEVELTAEGMRSWDRGFDADGVQVWGAQKGGYVFARTPPTP